MPRHNKRYSIFSPPTLSMSELVKTTLDHNYTHMLIEKWPEHCGGTPDMYQEWFLDVRERSHTQSQKGQLIAWNKGKFIPENIFCRTVDTGRLIPLARPWTTHVYHHHSVNETRIQVILTMLPELMLLRGMHNTGCDEIYIIMTNLKRQEMDDITEYFKLACRYGFGRACKPRIGRIIQHEHMRLNHTLLRQGRTPCFPQIDLTLRAILYEKRPRFIILFSLQPTILSQIFFTHKSYVPDEDIFYDYPTGCPNPYCTDDCETIRFPRRGLQTAVVLDIKTKRHHPRIKAKEMCNWIGCDVCFGEEPVSGSDCSEGTETNSRIDNKATGPTCGKCWLVKYCSTDHQKNDWAEHKKVCVKSRPNYPSFPLDTHAPT